MAQIQEASVPFDLLSGTVGDSPISASGDDFGVASQSQLRNQVLLGPAILGVAQPNLAASNLASTPRPPARAGTVQARSSPINNNLRAQGMMDFAQGYGRFLEKTHNVKYV